MMTRPEFLKLLWPPIFLPMLLGITSTSAVQVQWEYHIELVSTYARGDLPNLLAKRGNDGWELCTRTDRENGTAELIFKRKLP